MKRLSKYKFHIAAAFGLLLTAVVIFTSVNKVAPVSWGWYGTVNAPDGVALSGWDPVSYHKGEPVAGVAAHEMKWGDATWRFSSAENLKAFESAPERYAPAFGSFCAFAVSRGFTARIDPNAFHVADEVLYVFADTGVRDDWVAELNDNRSASVNNWALRK